MAVSRLNKNLTILFETEVVSIIQKAGLENPKIQKNKLLIFYQLF
jgi:hypothetical protein